MTEIGRERNEKFVGWHSSPTPVVTDTAVNMMDVPKLKIFRRIQKTFRLNTLQCRSEPSIVGTFSLHISSDPFCDTSPWKTSRSEYAPYFHLLCVIFMSKNMRTACFSLSLSLRQPARPVGRAFLHTTTVIVTSLVHQWRPLSFSLSLTHSLTMPAAYLDFHSAPAFAMSIVVVMGERERGREKDICTLSK